MLNDEKEQISGMNNTTSKFKNNLLNWKNPKDRKKIYFQLFQFYFQ